MPQGSVAQLFRDLSACVNEPSWDREHRFSCSYMNSRICQLHLKEFISTFLANILYLLAIGIFVIKIAFIKHHLSVAKVLKFDIYSSDTFNFIEFKIFSHSFLT